MKLTWRVAEQEAKSVNFLSGDLKSWLDINTQYSTANKKI